MSIPVELGKEVSGASLATAVLKAAESLRDYEIQETNTIGFRPGSVKKEVLDSKISIHALLSKGWWGKKMVLFEFPTIENGKNYESTVIKVFTCRRSSVLLISLFYVPAVIASLAAGLLTGWGGTFLAISISAGSATSVIGFVIFGMAWEWNGAGNNLAQDTEQELTKLLAEIYEGI